MGLLTQPYRRLSKTLRAPPSLCHTIRSARQTKHVTTSSVTCCWLRLRATPWMRCSISRGATDWNGGDEPVRDITSKTSGHCRTRLEHNLYPVVGGGFPAHVTRWENQVKEYEHLTIDNQGRAEVSNFDEAGTSADASAFASQRFPLGNV